MVHLCGGWFTYSNESIVGSFDHLVDYDVVMVSISHRISIFGEFDWASHSSGSHLHELLDHFYEYYLWYRLSTPENSQLQRQLWL